MGTAYHIVNRESGLVLDAAGNEGDTVWTLQQHNLDAGTDQKWILRADGGGYRILTANTGYAKALTNKDATEKTAITIEGSNTSRGCQEWYLEPADGSVLEMTSSQTYTEGGRHVSTVTDMWGNVTSYAYGENDQGRLLTGITDASGATTTYGYDINDRVTSVSRSGTDAAVSYTYEQDQLTSISHNGFTYAFTYDVYGNVALVEAGGETLIFHEKHQANGRYGVPITGMGTASVMTMTSTDG